MKLSPVRYNPLVFGYNADYHKKVRETLLNNEIIPHESKAIVAAEDAALKIEDSIVEMEKKGEIQDIRYSDITSMLVDLKAPIVFYMSYWFPDLKYADNLTKQYTKEINEMDDDKKKSWREDFVNILKNETVDDKKNNSKEKLKEIIVDISNDSKTGKTPAVSNLLTKYVPAFDSPKGFDDVAGMDEVKERLNDEIVYYAKNPEQIEIDLREYGIEAPRGFIFYGPPGCGKTFVTKALAIESGLDMFKLDISKAGSKFINQTSNNLQEAFDSLKKYSGSTGKKVLLFMDEVDSFAMSRGEFARNDENLKTVSTLLKLVEEAKNSGIILIAATNKYDILDDAFKSRFDSQIYFPLPEQNQIKDLLKLSLSKREKGKALANSDKELEEFSKKLKGYSNRSIAFLVENAAKSARKNGRRDILIQDLENAASNSEFEKVDKINYKKSTNSKKAMGFN